MISIEDQLLGASLLCGMEPGGDPAYRLQLFLVTNKDLGSKSHQSDFQRALQTGVDTKGFWEHYQEGSGEYVITQLGYDTAKARLRNILPKYKPVCAQDFQCRLAGRIGNVDVVMQTHGRKTGVYVNGMPYRPATRICQYLEQVTPGLSLPTERNSAVRVLYDLAIDYGFDLQLEGAALLPKPTVLEVPQAVDLSEPTEAARTQYSVSRILRDTALSCKVKALHQYKCQICGESLQLHDGVPYAEAHHIKPLSHNGPDDEENILCVCPNHHALLDFGAIKLNVSQLRACPEHQVNATFVKYHNTKIFGKPRKRIV